MFSNDLSQCFQESFLLSSIKDCEIIFNIVVIFKRVVKEFSESIKRVVIEPSRALAGSFQDSCHSFMIVVRVIKLLSGSFQGCC